MKYWILLASQLAGMAITAPTLASSKKETVCQPVYYFQPAYRNTFSTQAIRNTTHPKGNLLLKSTSSFEVLSSSPIASGTDMYLPVKESDPHHYYSANPLPAPPPPCITTAHFTGRDTVCTGSSTSYKADFHTGSTYAWSVSGGSIVFGDSTDSIVIAWGAAGTGNIQLTETDSSCSSVTSVKVAVSPLPQPSIIGDSFVCPGTKALYRTHYDSGISYLWLIKKGKIISGQNTDSVLVHWLGSGTGTITLVETNASGCIDSLSKLIIINILPNTSLSGDSSLCAGASTLYIANFDSGITYRWHTNNGKIIAGQNTDSIIVYHTTPGTDSITLIESNTKGCRDSITRIIHVHALPSPSIFGDSSICSGRSALYIANPQNGVSYNWKVQDGAFRSGQNTDSATFVFNTPGYAKLSLIETNESGCTDSTVKVIRVYGHSAPAISGIMSACAGTTTSYTTSQNTGSTYQWKVINGTLLSGQNTDSVEINWAGKDSGKIVLIETNANGCTDSTTLLLKIFSKPVAGFQGDSLVCVGTSSKYKVSTVDSTLSYQWTVTNGTTLSSSHSDSISINWANAGLGSVKLIVTNRNGCKDSISRLVNIHALPLAHFAASKVGNGFTFRADDSLESSYVWDFGDSFKASGFIANHIYANSGTFKVNLTVTSVLGCIDSADTSITISISAINQALNNNFRFYIYPNPVRDELQVSYRLSATALVKIELLSTTGQIFSSVQCGLMEPGKHTLSINTAPLQAGVYFIRLSIDNRAITQQLIKLKQ